MVTKEAIFVEAKRRSEELVGQTEARINALKKAGNEYMDDALRRTEEVIADSLKNVRDTRMKFRDVVDNQERRKSVPELDV